MKGENLIPRSLSIAIPQSLQAFLGCSGKRKMFRIQSEVVILGEGKEDFLL
jgi:hypothetical protein